MNERQSRFIDEYLDPANAGNATQAYIRAGYKARGNAAETNAARLLRNAQVRAAIEARQSQRAQARDDEAARILQEYASLSFNDLRAIFGDDGTLKPIATWPESIGRSIAGLEVKTIFGKDDEEPAHILKVKFESKLRALHDLATHYGLLKQMIEHAGKDGGPLEVVVYVPENGRSTIATPASGDTPAAGPANQLSDKSC